MPPSAPAPVVARANDPLGGILMILVGMAFYSMSDATAKFLSTTVPAPEIAWMRYAAFTLIMMPMALRRGPSILRSHHPLLQVVRGGGMLGSAIFFIMGLKFLPIADATAMSFVSPMFITAMSIPVLGERVGIRRWAATLIGLLGVLIVIRPGGGSFQIASLLPLASAASWAIGVVTTRQMGVADSTSTSLLYAALVGLVVTSVMVPFSWQPFGLREVLLGGLIGIVSTTGQLLLILAFQLADASLLSPFTYGQIISSSLLGYLVFNAIPDRLTLLGTAVIVASGLYTAHRERMTARHNSRRAVGGSV